MPLLSLAKRMSRRSVYRVDEVLLNEPGGSIDRCGANFAFLRGYKAIHRENCWFTAHGFTSWLKWGYRGEQ